MPSKIVELLEDLHIGTFAIVRLGVSLGQEFSISNGVQHGCIVAPLLFNTFFDFVVIHALNNMRPDSEVLVHFQTNGNLLYFASPDEGLLLHQIALLLYANDMVLFSTNLKNLVLMLQCMDTVAERFAMKINATKTMVMLMRRGTHSYRPPSPLARAR